MRWRRQELKQRLAVQKSSFLILFTVNIVFLIDSAVFYILALEIVCNDLSVDENPGVSEQNKMFGKGDNITYKADPSGRAV
jgi:hypothetical protein